MDSQRQSDPSQETPLFENKENLKTNQNKDLQPQNKESLSEQSKAAAQTKSHGEDKLTLVEEIDAFEKGFQYAADFLAGSFDTIVNLVRSNDQETEKHDKDKDRNKGQDEKFERFKKELMEKTSPSPKKHEEPSHPHHHLHADSQSFKPTEESKMPTEHMIEGHEGPHHHLSAESQSFKPNPDTKILTEKVIEGLEDRSASLIDKAHEAEKEIEEVHSHQGASFTTPSKMMEKRKSEEFWFPEDGPVREQPKKMEHEENRPGEERVPLLDKVIHGYQAVANTISYVKNIISPAKQAKLKEEEGENISGKKKGHQKRHKKEKRAVGADITNKATSSEEKGKRKESWSGKIGRKLSETIKETLNFGAQEDNPKIA